MVNLIKYAFNLQPLVADNTNLTWAGSDTILSNNFSTLNYSGNAAAVDVLFGVNVSSNLMTLVLREAI